MASTPNADSLPPYGVAYCVISLVDGRRYVGVTAGQAARRWGQHKRSAAKGRAV